MKNLFQSIFPFLVFVLILGSCKKNNDTTTTVNYKVTTTNRSSIVARVESGGIIWTSGSGYVHDIELGAKKDSSDVEFKSDVNRRIDLFTPLVDLGGITFAPGIYKKVEIKVDFMSTAADSAFVLRGNFTSSTAVVSPVLFIVNEDTRIESEAANVTLNGASYSALTTLNLSLLTTGITETMFTNATRTGSTIVISGTSNTGLYNIIYNNMRDMDSCEVDN